MRARPIVLVELVGLPGSGTSTVAKELAATGATVHGRYRSWRQIPAYVRSAISLAPTLVSATLHGWSLRDARRLLRLASSDSVVERSARSPGAGALVFDQGPLFLLRQLTAAEGGGRQIAELRERYLRRWARRLDLVIVLDASDATLLERIRTRDKAHRLKGAEPRVAQDRLAAERRSQEAIIELVAAAGRAAVRTIDTSSAEIDETVDVVRACIGELTSFAEPA